ncbi:2Fe-2S iron-sulfur cluster-binding protein [Bosea lathyri]|uniref:Ferredoxin, 2Fe-2S n=1 Tax=Bosea lathyri TaxID=1036778 RepID=A0A1H5V0H2_9HYPH|nr:2Fe-2S iron-sulfur cluster-binding protein [Bosea lathyri]SEF80704.1 ferredoxin, 2Fe-2S [Bosea lathyri]
MHVRVVDREGEERELEALEGWRLMEIIRDWGLPIKAECGGACACATCHVYVAQDWVEKLHPPREDELDRLDEAYDVRPNSRLACQILFSPELDGLTVVLAPELA